MIPSRESPFSGFQSIYRDSKVYIGIPKYISGFQSIYRDSKVYIGIPKYISGFQSIYRDFLTTG
ncbi:hypothetical protein FHP05_14640 [Cerasibacillus terrae]|uniref:Uncharacterized protein n=1 Tax=Cerasibacillus terrae TaxID=2498845 RepID=A0A5C8NGA0_9BACI|nr:hypothetical protein [Cerasibacillus terrae]TXL57845.1 hypothetical protein FHP05_14640 [Cerasibacillus terrae]